MLNHEVTKNTKSTQRNFAPNPAHTEAIAAQIIDAAIKVHKALGPGLLESVYEACLCYELTKRSIPYRRQVDVPVRFEEVFVETGFRADVIADECVLAENKAKEEVLPIDKAQLLTHMKLTNIRLGLMLNFNVVLMKDGITRMVL
jgi:GxxExxY protein